MILHWDSIRLLDLKISQNKILKNEDFFITKKLMQIFAINITLK